MGGPGQRPGAWLHRPALAGWVGIIAAERTGSPGISVLGIPRHPMQAADADQARRLGAAAYHAASVPGDLSAAEALLADAWRACPDLLPPAETALATAFVLLHGDGDRGRAPGAAAVPAERT